MPYLSRKTMSVFFLFSFAFLCVTPAMAQQESTSKPNTRENSSETVKLWKGKAPGETVELPPEADTTKPDQPPTGGGRVTRIGNVSNPTLEIFRPDPAKFPMNGKLTKSQTAVIICPGGGHRILAYDLEGTEVARWLANQGITGIVLKYRVPARDPENKAHAAVQDAQRAIRWVRSQSESLGISADRIGIMGFSAGGEVAARATLLCDRDHYPKADAATDPVDQFSAKPNFAALIYPAYLVAKDQSKLLEELNPASSTPPVFMVHAWNDNVTPLSSLYLAAELKRANVPCELHMYSTGGHGYGLRHVENVPVTDWPGPFGHWLKVSGWLEK
jgi:acetyl esterase/lipase